MYNYRCKIENLCTGCVCTMDMFASLNFHTFIFYFPMVFPLALVVTIPNDRVKK